MKFGPLLEEILATPLRRPGRIALYMLITPRLYVLERN